MIANDQGCASWKSQFRMRLKTLKNHIFSVLKCDFSAFFASFLIPISSSHNPTNDTIDKSFFEHFQKIEPISINVGWSFQVIWNLLNEIFFFFRKQFSTNVALIVYITIYSDFISFFTCCSSQRFNIMVLQ